jgi:hypothetical protein
MYALAMSFIYCVHQERQPIVTTLDTTTATTTTTTTTNSL